MGEGRFEVDGGEGEDGRGVELGCQGFTELRYRE
jgi:hypothetical protein